MLVDQGGDITYHNRTKDTPMRIKDAVEDFGFSVMFRCKGDIHDPDFVDEDKWGEPTERLFDFISDHGIYEGGNWHGHGGPEDEEWFDQSYDYTPSGEYYWDNHGEWDFIQHIKIINDVQEADNNLHVYWHFDGEEFFDGHTTEHALKWLRENCYFPVCKMGIDHHPFRLYKSPETEDVFIDVPAGEAVKEGSNTIFLAKDKYSNTVEVLKADVEITGERSFQMEDINKYKNGNKKIFEDRRKWREENLSQPELEYIKKREPDFQNRLSP